MALHQQRAEPSPKGFNVSSAPGDDGDDRRKAGRTGEGQRGGGEETEAWGKNSSTTVTPAARAMARRERGMAEKKNHPGRMTRTQFIPPLPALAAWAARGTAGL